MKTGITHLVWLTLEDPAGWNDTIEQMAKELNWPPSVTENESILGLMILSGRISGGSLSPAEFFAMERAKRDARKNAEKPPS